MMLSSRRRLQGRMLLLLVAMVAVSFGAWLPWEYPSSSMLYKFGIDRDILTLGKSAGVAAIVLMGLQILFIARFTMIERLVGYDRMVRIHRMVGISIVALAVMHPLLVFSVDDVATIPVKWEYWPEILGGGLLISLSIYAAIAYGRSFSRIPYHYWKWMHQAGAIVLVVTSLVHVYYVTDSYHSGVPLVFLVCVGIVVVVCWGWILFRPFMDGEKHEVVSLTRVGPAARELRLRPLGNPIRHAPGQFAYINVTDGPIPSEPHPFTISSSPGSDTLRFVIRCCGDWTNRVGQLRTGDTVQVSGPYGMFSPEAYGCEAGYVCIAGGVGITPMLSMIENMDELSPPLHLVWSNRTVEDAFAREELKEHALRLHQLDVTHVFSRDATSADNEYTGRVNHDLLDRVLTEVPLSDSLFFVCGPQPFMESVQRTLSEMGVPPSQIVTEEFGF